MSRTRIIKGTYTKITHGDHNMFSQENINSYAGDIIKEKGEDSGVSYGSPQDPPKPEIVAKCVVHFRPDRNYKNNPNFGFDWIKIEDTGYQGDVWYKEVIGKYRNPTNNSLLQVYNSGAFTKDLQAYNKICNSFGALILKARKDAGKRDYMYYVPKMTLRKGVEAALILKINVDEAPKKMTFSYDKSCFAISDYPGDEIKSKSKGIRTLPLKIKCKKIFNANLEIKILADDHVCGKIVVLANNFEYSVKVVFVDVKTNVKKVLKGQIYMDEKNKLKNLLSQAYINANLQPDETLDLTGFFTSQWFKWWYTQNNGEIKTAELHKYLNEKLHAQDSKYKNYYKIYVFGATSDGLNGIAENVGHGVKSAIVFPGRLTSDPSLGSSTHEVLHTMGLYHTFDNDSDFTFERAKLDNIMDYSHWNNIPRISTTHWQWSLLQRELSSYKKAAV